MNWTWHIRGSHWRRAGVQGWLLYACRVWRHVWPIACVTLCTHTYTHTHTHKHITLYIHTHVLMHTRTHIKPHATRHKLYIFWGIWRRVELFMINTCLQNESCEHTTVTTTHTCAHTPHLCWFMSWVPKSSPTNEPCDLLDNGNTATATHTDAPTQIYTVRATKGTTSLLIHGISLQILAYVWSLWQQKWSRATRAYAHTQIRIVCVTQSTTSLLIHVISHQILA